MVLPNYEGIKFNKKKKISKRNKKIIVINLIQTIQIPCECGFIFKFKDEIN